MLQVKSSVIGLHQVDPVLVIAAQVYDYVRVYFGWGDGTITSAMDQGDNIGAPRSETSAHPWGMALDLRTRDLSADQVNVIAYVLRLVLPQVQVIVESDHIHIQVNGWRQVLASRGVSVS